MDDTKLDLEPIDDSRLDLEPLDLEPVYSEPSTFSDFLSGGKQGLTFGFSDEIAAALEAAKDVAFTDKTLKDLPSLYRQLQESKQKELAEARERSPGAYLAGELGGALLPSLFTFGAAAPASALTTGATAARELSALAKIGKAAKTGAAIGAVTGAGTSEAPLLSKEGLVETAKGAAMGGLIGGASSGLMEGAKKGYRALAKEHRAVEELGIAAKEGAAGRGFTSTSSEIARRAEEEGAAADVMKKFLGTAVKDAEGNIVGREGGLRQIYGKQISDSLSAAKEAGKVIKTDLNYINDFQQKFINTIPKGIFGKQQKAVQELLDAAATGSLDPVQANELRQIIRDVLVKNSDIPFDAKTAARSLSTHLKENLIGQVPGFKEANQSFSKLMKNIPESIISKLPEDFRTDYFTLSSAAESDFGDALRHMVKKGGKPGEPGFEARGLLEKLKEGVKKEFELNPEKFKAAGLNSPEELYGNLEHVSKISGIRQALIGEEPHSGLVKRMLAFLTPRGTSLRAAQFAGEGYRLGQKGLSAAYKLPDEALRLVSKKIAESGSERLKPIAAALEQSIASGNQRAKRAALFTLLQHKEGRDALNSE